MKQQLSKIQKLSFGFGAIGKDAIFNIVSLYLMYYITDIVGLSPAFVGVLFFIARIWDALNDPFMGMIVDNTHNRFGKFKTWIVIGTVINAIVTVLLFTHFDLPGIWMYVYIAVMYILWGMTYTMMDIPYWSWLPNLTHQAKEREALSVIPRFFASLAAFTVGTFGLYLIEQLGNGNGAKGIFIFAVLCSVVFIVTIAVTVIVVPEDRAMEAQEGIKVRFRDVKRILFQNKELLAMMGVLLTFNLCVQTLNGTIIYYFKYVVEMPHFFSYFNAMILAEMAGLLLLPLWIGKVGRQTAFNSAIISIVGGLTMILIFGWLAPKVVIWVIIGAIALRIGTGFMIGMTTIAIADVIDYGEVKFGHRNESIITSTNTFLTKTSQAISALIVGLGLSVLGFVPNETQTMATQQGLRMMVIVMPIVLVLTSALLYHKAFHLKGDYLRDIERTLTIKRQREQSHD
ncbi:melibiose:sodium transporter MelB [Staphylococcus delphini]|uniref:melibiose:sodium transporter MelB n=1 Tax=Staphylococcus delphini TaxID=53344 RepID=UPI000BBC35E4|nr:melibiose:sodium transporter MelB [Staphylococcus delphini]PCF49223.1 melibiose:sodium transporter MelB [Staphylococcus delphini]PCF76390.1 melibiose:sodium transporter MelB [Staphylococcus delphini]